jgi:hypothetical protein
LAPPGGDVAVELSNQQLGSGGDGNRQVLVGAASTIKLANPEGKPKESSAAVKAVPPRVPQAIVTMADMATLGRAEIERLTHLRQNRTLKEPDRKISEAIDRRLAERADEILTAAIKIGEPARAELGDAGVDDTYFVAAVLARLIRMIESPGRPAAPAEEMPTTKRSKTKVAQRKLTA